MRRSEREQSPLAVLAISVGLGSAISVAITAVLVIVMAIIISKNPSNPDYIYYLSYIAVAIGAISGGFAAARRVRKRGVVPGLLSGIPSSIVCMVVAGLVCGEATLMLAVLPILIILMSGAGGIVAANLPRRR